MARYEFKFVVSDVELSEEHQQRVGHAVVQAGALALADFTPPEAVTVMFGRNWWWRGIPPVALQEELRNVAAERATSG